MFVILYCARLSLYVFCRHFSPCQKTRIYSDALLSVLPSIPFATIISLSSQNNLFPSPYPVLLNLLCVSICHHCLYIPGISSVHRPHHTVISPEITRVLLCWGGTLLLASKNRHLHHPASMLLQYSSSHVSTVAISIFLLLSFRHNYCPTSLMEISSTVISSTPLV